MCISAALSVTLVLLVQCEEDWSVIYKMDIVVE